MRPSEVSVTVRFGRHVTREQIAALVQQIAKESGAYYTEYRRFNGAELSFGQWAKYPQYHIRVAPSRRVAYFDQAKLYREVEIMNHIWPEPTFAVGVDKASVATAVNEFARKLSAAYEAALKSGFPAYKLEDDDEWLLG